MSTFIQKLPQKSQVNIYYPGSDHCNGNTNCNANTPVESCTGCDWQFSTVACKDDCPSQPICSEIDGNTCPQIGKNILYQWATSGEVCLMQKGYPMVECTYDAKSFDYSDVLLYRNKFCDSGNNCNSAPTDVKNNYNSVIMPNFCLQDTTICPKQPGSEDTWKTCPIILSNISGSLDPSPGLDCMNWSNFDSTDYDKSIYNYCYNNTSPVCDCINRDNSDVYNYIQRGLSTIGEISDPSCWFVPCGYPKSYLIPTDLNNKNCSASVCNKINQVISNVPTDLTLSQLNESLNCTITSTPTPVVITGSTDTTTTTGTSNSFLLYFGIGVLILAIIIIILLFIFA